MLLHALYERLCTAPLNRLPCYGALEVIVTLLLLSLTPIQYPHTKPNIFHSWMSFTTHCCKVFWVNGVPVRP